MCIGIKSQNLDQVIAKNKSPRNYLIPLPGIQTEALYTVTRGMAIVIPFRMIDSCVKVPLDAGSGLFELRLGSGGFSSFSSSSLKSVNVFVATGCWGGMCARLCFNLLDKAVFVCLSVCPGVYRQTYACVNKVEIVSASWTECYIIRSRWLLFVVYGLMFSKGFSSPL